MTKDYAGDGPFPVGDRQTFTIPEGHEAVRDADGRATGETRPIAAPTADFYDDGDKGIADELADMDLSDAVGAAVAAEIPEPFVVRELKAKAEIFRERNKIYGDNYKRFGPIMSMMLAGQIIDCNDSLTMARLGVFVQVIAKATRYGENFNRGGHDDSLDDIAVYAMMLKELDQK